MDAPLNGEISIIKLNVFIDIFPSRGNGDHENKQPSLSSSVESVNNWQDDDGNMLMCRKYWWNFFSCKTLT